jgi:hypothetical protein
VGTVGAVAVDEQGHVAVATSTGGISGKLVGRVGDTPLPGELMICECEINTKIQLSYTTWNIF